MKTRISTIVELKKVFLEILFSKTDKVSKVSSTSNTNAIAYANAKISQKALKDIAILESQLFPEYATGDTLLLVAQRYGIFARLGQCGSSVFIYLYGTPGTIYNAAVNTFISTEGITYKLDNNVTIPECKYIYVKASSIEIGESTNSSALSIVTCLLPPTGHIFCTNTFSATGGRNEESDEELLHRIQNVHNIFAIKTLDYLTQIALRGGYNILKFVHLGISHGKTRLGVVTQNASSLSDIDLNGLLVYLQPYFSLADIASEINSKVILENVYYTPIDIDMKLEFLSDLYTIDEIYSNLQRKLVDYIDFRYWDNDVEVKWDEVLNLVRNTEGVTYVPYADFKINGGANNIKLSEKIFPKFRSFLLYDKNGSILINSGSTTNSVVYYNPYNQNFSLLS